MAIHFAKKPEIARGKVSAVGLPWNNLKRGAKNYCSDADGKKKWCANIKRYVFGWSGYWNRGGDDHGGEETDYRKAIIDASGTLRTYTNNGLDHGLADSGTTHERDFNDWIDSMIAKRSGH
jgi:hypothetical protein